MTFVKLYTKPYCANCVEAEALLRSQHFEIMTYQIDGIIPEEISSITDGKSHLPLAIIDGQTYVGLPAIKNYVAIEH